MNAEIDLRAALRSGEENDFYQALNPYIEIYVGELERLAMQRSMPFVQRDATEELRLLANGTVPNRNLIRGFASYFAKKYRDRIVSAMIQNIVDQDSVAYREMWEEVYVKLCPDAKVEELYE